MANKVNLQTGRFKYNDGGWYVGQHCGDGKRHGQGIYTYPNGDVFDGSFIMGKYVDSFLLPRCCCAVCFGILSARSASRSIALLR